MKRKVTETESKSVYINIPRRYADYLGLKVGEDVELGLIGEFIVLRKVKEDPLSYVLKDLCRICNRAVLEDKDLYKEVILW